MVNHLNTHRLNTHGGWGYFKKPLLLGLLLAHQPSGLPYMAFPAALT
jgi:hypothetical protein